jgi:hypothetical protein
MASPTVNAAILRACFSSSLAGVSRHLLLLGHKIALAQDARQLSLFVNHRCAVDMIVQQYPGGRSEIHIRRKGDQFGGHDVACSDHHMAP